MSRLLDINDSILCAFNPTLDTPIAIVIGVAYRRCYRHDAKKALLPKPVPNALLCPSFSFSLCQKPNYQTDDGAGYL